MWTCLLPIYGVFVELNKIAHSYGKTNIAGGAERVYAQLFLEPGDDHRQTQRVEP